MHTKQVYFPDQYAISEWVEYISSGQIYTTFVFSNIMPYIQRFESFNRKPTVFDGSLPLGSGHWCPFYEEPAPTSHGCMRPNAAD